MSTIEAGVFHQTTFGSLIRRNFVRWNNQGFFVTREGFDAMSRFETADILRRVARTELTKYFTGVGIRIVKRRAA